LLLSGEILGASGLISATLLFPRKALTDPSVAWKLLLLASLMLISNTILGSHFADDVRTREDPSLTIVSTYAYLVGGLLVGFGTKLGHGCTSGHGICGLARLSKRSFVSVITFMLAAISATTIVAPDNSAFSTSTAFLRAQKAPELVNQKLGLTVTVPLVLASIFALLNLWKAVRSLNEDEPSSSRRPLLESNNNNTETLNSSDLDSNEDGENEEATANGKAPAADAQKPPQQNGEAKQASSKDTIEVEKKYSSNRRIPNRHERVAIQDGVGKLIPALVVGPLFALGLALSGMVIPSKILGFLNLFLVNQGTWDPTLLTVMASGSIFSWIAYQFVEGVGILSNKFALECPRGSSSFSIPTNTVVDFHLVGGALCFGAGWGIAGLCPGPALFLAASGTAPIIYFWWPTYIAGAFLAQTVQGWK
jgi:uncharacterized membrane protein YedE/YeeE